MSAHHDDAFHRLEQEAMDSHMAWLDNTEGTTTGRWTRHLAERSSRRGALARLGKAVVGLTGVAVLPALPVRRASAQDDAPIDFTGTDPTDCNYWRYCNLGGRLCADCEGGGITTCPPGTVLGVEYWVGCCVDPASGTTYLTANYDCCGKSGCGGSCGEPWQQGHADRCGGRLDRSKRAVVHECPTQSYTCTIVPLIGENCQARPAPRNRAEFEAQQVPS